MEFEYDPEKSQTNKQKHGIDFEEAQKLWLDRNAIELPARSVGEKRWFRIGKISRVLWTAVFTKRGEKVRLISVRKPHANERKNYRPEDD